ncbi:MAG: hypothetical protein HY558_07660 [Euryarchaeota archaeon]|nr:hypothetical protein [Euryarchaeota archaeon]
MSPSSKKPAPRKKAAARKTPAKRAPPKPKDPIVQLLSDLPGLYIPGKFPRETTIYLSLGEHQKWTLVAGPKKLRVVRAKLTERADGVLKTSPQMFLRMVNKGYIPNMVEVSLGLVKTNRPDLLKRFNDSIRR